MPYRRLPNTDNARIKALKTAIQKNRTSPTNRGIVLSDNPKLDAMLRNFENAQVLYRDCLSKQVSENRKFQKLIKNARLYISHFIQVLNFGVIRNEIKKDAKRYYQLDPENYSVPDLSNNDALLAWGENIVKGEAERLQHGGTPIYNPTIARVNVAYSQFKDAYFSQKTYQNSTSRQLDVLSKQRDDIDIVLCQIWNEIEEAFAGLPPTERLEKCKEFGVVYYLRKKERETLQRGDS